MVSSLKFNVKIMGLFLSALFTLDTSSSSLSEYEIDYKAQYNGLDVKATYTLKHEGDNRFVEYSSVKNILGEITEISEFQLINEEQIRSEKFKSKRTLIGNKRLESSSFDWEKKLAIYTKDNTTKSFGIEKKIYDPVSAKVQLRLDIKSNKNSYVYDVLTKGKIKRYKYEVLGNDLIETASGNLDTVKVKRIHEDNKKRQTVFWLARDWDFVLVKLNHRDKKETYSIEILRGFVSGNEIN